MNPHLDELNDFTFTRLARLLADVTAPVGLAPINLSIGEPKHPTPALIIDALRSHTASLAQYPPTKGPLALRQAIAAWIARRFSLPPLDAETQVLPVLGSKEALYSFTQTIIDPTRSNPRVLVPNPFYMVYEGAALLCGAKPHFVDYDASTRQYRWEDVPESVWQDTQLVIVCSPDNPTGTVTARERWRWLFDQSDRYGFVIVADECYSEIYFDEGAAPIGALQVAAEAGRHDFRRLVAMGSLSKRSNAPGLRSGFVAGDAALLAAFLKLRSFNGAAMSGTVAAASIAAWNDEAHVRENRAAYARKFRELTPLMARHLPVAMPDAAFYWWLPVPPSYAGDDERFTRELFAATGVTVTPGTYLSRPSQSGATPGRGHVRVALVAAFDECREAVDRMAAFLARPPLS